jgi:hypothetical protein
VNRQVGQYLPVHLNTSLVEAVDQAAVGEAKIAGGGIDALDPQSPKIALLHATVAIRVLHALLDRLPGNADRVLATAIIALGLLQNLLVLRVGRYTPLDACHVKTPSGQRL